MHPAPDFHVRIDRKIHRCGFRLWKSDIPSYAERHAVFVQRAEKYLPFVGELVGLCGVYRTDPRKR